jgi:hypothetical protein
MPNPPDISYVDPKSLVPLTPPVGEDINNLKPLTPPVGEDIHNLKPLPVPKSN